MFGGFPHHSVQRSTRKSANDMELLVGMYEYMETFQQLVKMSTQEDMD